MNLVEIGQIIKPIIFCSMSLLSVASLFMLAYIERRD